LVNIHEMKILFSHPTGNANVRSALKGLQQQGFLVYFYTSIASFSGSFLDRISNFSPLAEIKRRKFESTLQAVTVSHPVKEFGRLITTKLGLFLFIKHETGCFSIDAVYNNIDRKVANALKRNNKINAVYAYEDGAFHSFKIAKKLGITCLYDLPIGYWRTARLLLEEERNLRPDWASTLTGFKDSKNKLERKDTELALADQIIVASSFTKLTLNDYPGVLAPITVIPYGFPPVTVGRVYESLENRPLKLLFVGGLSQRKGIANLLEAVNQLGDAVTLTIVGHKSVEDCIPLNEALNRHEYISSLAHEEILGIMREHDVFVFPSLFEGFGLVITEAMSQGTPVITTNRTAGPDLITDGENGWLVEAGSTKSLRQCIEMLLAQPHLVQKAGLAAMKTASLRPWDSYSRELGNFLQKKLTK
jgi:glycosyltransferase involved in cell wall biosynthesis